MLVADGEEVEGMLVGAPCGEVVIHECDEAGVVGGFDEVEEFVDDEVFEALGGLFGEVRVEADGSGEVVAASPACFHALDEELPGLDAEAGFPLGDEG